jgi:hypothetical protein
VKASKARSPASRFRKRERGGRVPDRGLEHASQPRRSEAFVEFVCPRSRAILERFGFAAP